MTSAQPHTSKDSKPAISGNFSLFGQLTEFTQTYGDRASKSLEAVIEDERKALKDTLSQHPDWSDLADKSDVQVNDGDLEYIVDDPYAMDLEYGNPQKNIVATGLLRATAVSRATEVTSGLSRRIMEGLQ